MFVARVGGECYCPSPLKFGGFSETEPRDDGSSTMPGARARHNDEMIQHTQGFLPQLTSEIHLCPSPSSGHRAAAGRA